MKKIFIHVRACQERYLDANRLRNYFLENGHEIVNDPKHADIILFVACAVYDEVAQGALEVIKEFQKYKAELIVAGCLPAIAKEKLSEIFHGKIISTKDLDKNTDLIDSLFPENKIKFSSIKDANFSFENLNERGYVGAVKKTIKKSKKLEKISHKLKDHLLKNLIPEQLFLYDFLSKRPLYRIRISWGCTGNCSYCSIKKAVGPLKSKPIDKIMLELEEGLKQGYKEIVVNGDDIGSYGLDIDSTFFELLDKMTSLDSDYQLMLENINFKWIIGHGDDLERIIRTGKIKSAEIDIQSGSRRILKLMNRYSNAEKMKEELLKIRKTFPDLIMYSCAIVGFPTETEEDFEKTLNLFKEIQFNSFIIFPFYCNEGTEAENIGPKIPNRAIMKRVKYAKKFLKKVGKYKIYKYESKIYFIKS